MHNTNSEWFWNSATNNPSALPAPNTLSMYRASNLSRNAIITDVNICFGMRNVNLNQESVRSIKNVSHRCKYSIPRPLIPPNWYKNYARYLHRDNSFAKFHHTPMLISNELNALVVNEYSSANMRGVPAFPQGMPTTKRISPIRDSKCAGENEFVSTISHSVTETRDEISEPSLTPPKKKWIRHYMKGE